GLRTVSPTRTTPSQTFPPVSTRSCRSATAALSQGGSAQDQEVKPGCSSLRARCFPGVLNGAAEPFFAAAELLIGEVAHGGGGVTEGVGLAEEIGEAGRVCLRNLLKGVPAEPGGGERLASLLDGGVAADRPGDLGKPAGEFDPVGP